LNTFETTISGLLKMVTLLEVNPKPQFATAAICFALSGGTAIKSPQVSFFVSLHSIAPFSSELYDEDCGVIICGVHPDTMRIMANKGAANRIDEVNLKSNLFKINYSASNSFSNAENWSLC
jgi:hypothetical protein